ncbi:mitochondrial ribosome recycling factor 1 [Carabus blaptoides fortunei]
MEKPLSKNKVTRLCVARAECLKAQHTKAQREIEIITAGHDSRFYAKGKDKKKEKGKKKVEINESQLAEIINLDSLRTQMKKSVDTLKEEYVKNLSLRSTTGAIESININFDGKDHTLQELAQIVRKNPGTVIINMSTFPQAIPAVLKAFAKSGMNLNPNQDGTTIYVPVPKVTKEHRENLSKNAKALFIKCKDHIRDTQMKFTKNVKKQDNLASDLMHTVQDQIGSIGDQYIAEAEKILISKQSELIG